MTAAIEPAAVAMGQWVLKHGVVCAASDVAADHRFGGARQRRRLRLSAANAGDRRSARWSASTRWPAVKEPRFAPATQAALLCALEPGAIALDNALRVQRAEALSVTDDLTQLYNSRYLSQVLRRETKRASRSGRPLSLLFIDLDGFKAINDTHGHLYGSRALVEAAGADSR